VCGRITEDGTARCFLHKHGGAKPTLCAECGRLTSGSRYCPEHTLTAAQIEKRRRQSQPWRREYDDPAYQTNRWARYDLARGRCEDCGRPLKGHLFPNGAPWECDHVVALSDLAGNEISNLRCLCLDHHHAKTRADRRSRGRL
jgi:hypothetical protein